MMTDRVKGNPEATARSPVRVGSQRDWQKRNCDLSATHTRYVTRGVCRVGLSQPLYVPACSMRNSSTRL